MENETEITEKVVKCGRPKKKRVGRPPKVKDFETVRASLIIPAEIHKSLFRLARHKGNSFNDFVNQIFDEFVKKNSPVLAILDETDRRIAELETSVNNSKAGDDVAEN